MWQFFLKCFMPMYLIGIIGLIVAGWILAKPLSMTWEPVPHQTLGTVMMVVSAVMALGLGEVGWVIDLARMSPEERRIARNLAPYIGRILDL